MNKTSLSTGLALALLAAAAASGQDADGAAEPYVNPCEQSPGTDFNFWVGEWVVFDHETGIVQGVDEVELHNNGCTIVQHWSQLTDMLRPPGADFCFAGTSLSSVLSDGRWQQVWSGNWGGTITLTGGLDDQGRMVLTTGPQTSPDGRVIDQTWYWEQRENGVVHNWGEARVRNEDGSWGEPQTMWHGRHVPRLTSPDLIAAPDGGSEE